MLTITPPPNFSFYETVHSHGWRALLPFSWDEGTKTLSRVQQLSSGAVAALTITGDDSGIRVAGAPVGSEDEVRGIVARMLQLDHDLTPFYQVCADHPELAPLVGSCKGRMLRSPTLYEDICKVILTTNTTWGQTTSMSARLIEVYGAPLPGGDQRAYPRPETISRISLDDFAATVRLGYRSAAIHQLSAKVATGELDLEALESHAADTESVRKSLLALRGVGPYAASCLMLYLGRPTTANVDSWARTLLSKELGHPVTDKEVHAHFAKYGDWQGLVYNWYPWREG